MINLLVKRCLKKSFIILYNFVGFYSIVQIFMQLNKICSYFIKGILYFLAEDFLF